MAIPLNSAADRRRPTLWDGVVALAVLVLAGLSLLLFPDGAVGRTAIVTVDGRELVRLELSQPGEYQLDTDYPITLIVKDGTVRVGESQCPGQDCLRTGTICRHGQTIVCLPNRLVVSILGTNNNDVDAVTG